MAEPADPQTPSAPSNAYLVAQVHHGVRARLETALKPYGLTPLQYTLLDVISAHDGISSADLSRRFFVTPQTMGETISGLEKRALVARKDLPNNKRTLHIVLTDEGRAMVADCDARLAEIEAAIFGALPKDQLKRLRTALHDVALLLRRPQD